MAIAEGKLRPVEVIERYGQCLELVPLDRRFHDISVGLYVKDGVCTIWTFSRRDGVESRIREIREQMMALGGMEAVEGSENQVRFPCGHLHERTLRFVMSQAVGKAPDYAPPQGELTIRDSKSALTIRAELSGNVSDGRAVYNVWLEGEARNAAMRLRMVLAGFARYGEMEQVGESGVAFACGYAPRRPHARPAALLPQHLQRRDHDGRRGPPRPDDHGHAGLFADVTARRIYKVALSVRQWRLSTGNLMVAGLLRWTEIHEFRKLVNGCHGRRGGLTLTLKIRE